MISVFSMEKKLYPSGGRSPTFIANLGSPRVAVALFEPEPQSRRPKGHVSAVEHVPLRGYRYAENNFYQRSAESSEFLVMLIPHSILSCPAHRPARGSW